MRVQQCGWIGGLSAGGSLLIERLVPSLDLGDVWPVFLIVLGLAILAGSIRRTG